MVLLTLATLEPSNPKLVSFQGTSASREAETDRQKANVQERMGWG
jgi:hypothetical protein